MKSQNFYFKKIEIRAARCVHVDNHREGTKRGNLAGVLKFLLESQVHFGLISLLK